MSVADWFRLALRLAHALAAAVWLGGGVYYLLVLRPAAREQGELARALTVEAQRRFGEWAQAASIIMLATGAALGFDRLSAGAGGLTYAALLALKVVAAVIAFWLAGLRVARRAPGRGSRRRGKPEVAVGLGALAFVLGVVLAAIWGRGLA